MLLSSTSALVWPGRRADRPLGRPICMTNRLLPSVNLYWWLLAGTVNGRRWPRPGASIFSVSALHSPGPGVVFWREAKEGVEDEGGWTGPKRKTKKEKKKMQIKKRKNNSSVSAITQVLNTALVRTHSPQTLSNKKR